MELYYENVKAIPTAEESYENGKQDGKEEGYQKGKEEICERLREKLLAKGILIREIDEIIENSK